MEVEDVVRERYRQGAQERVADLCCPVDYDPLSRGDPGRGPRKGCGDPSRHLQPGETVLDFGSGTGKICFIASQVVGASGRVIGVDMTGEMLAVARRNAPVVAERLGFANVEFRRTRPLIADCSVDVVVSNCVLNLVDAGEKERLFQEIHRVLRHGGRAVISDIVSDEEVPLALRQDPELWSGCISGALTESGFLAAFEAAGFHGIRILERQPEPWRTIDDIEFRSLSVEAFKGKEGICLERKQAVIYKGPFREVLDDDGHRLRRGERFAVCDKTFQLYRQEPYRSSFEFVEPLEAVPLEAAPLFDCSRTAPRHPKETKGQDYQAITEAEPCCASGNCC
jgi:SAM-dependent methyltransferase